jgi:endogenous inhibitor of DNA gyrase (YacG/DUF329 family)
MQDLGNWASEGYRIAGDPAEPPLAEDEDRDDDTE